MEICGFDVCKSKVEFFNKSLIQHNNTSPYFFLLQQIYNTLPYFSINRLYTLGLVTSGRSKKKFNHEWTYVCESFFFGMMHKHIDMKKNQKFNLLNMSIHYTYTNNNHILFCKRWTINKTNFLRLTSGSKLSNAS